MLLCSIKLFRIQKGAQKKLQESLLKRKKKIRRIFLVDCLDGKREEDDESSSMKTTTYYFFYSSKHCK